MRGYLLDTHILIWLLSKDDRLNKYIREDIEYFQYPYYVSVESFREIVMLRHLKKISISLERAISYLQQFQMTLMPIGLNHVKELEKLPELTFDGEKHNDPFDRMLIAQAIAEKFTLISADGKFPFYKKHGLKLLENNI